MWATPAVHLKMLLLTDTAQRGLPFGIVRCKPAKLKGYEHERAAIIPCCTAATCNLLPVLKLPQSIWRHGGTAVVPVSFCMHCFSVPVSHASKDSLTEIVDNSISQDRRLYRDSTLDALPG